MTFEEAIDAGYADWDAANCHERGCGCVTEYIKRRIAPLVADREQRIRLERGAALREAGEAAEHFQMPRPFLTEGWLCSPDVFKVEIQKAILALIPASDASALDKYVAEKIQQREYRDILEYLNDFRRMTGEEFADTHGKDVRDALDKLLAEARAEAFNLCAEAMDEAVPSESAEHHANRFRLWANGAAGKGKT
jgi:hypothetical protein